MSFISRLSDAGVGAGRAIRAARNVSSMSTTGVARLSAVALAAATLAACAQGPGASNQPGAYASRHTADSDRRSSSAGKRTSTSTASKDSAETQGAAHGIASFYRPTRTASGEKANAGELTAAHRTLPFGTRVRVTDVATGKSVTVRVNDRGPFIPGRVVDVSHSAAESLGITGRGIAKVKLDVVE